MSTLAGIAMFLVGVALCVAVQELKEVDRRRQRAQMQTCRARGDHEGAVRAACRRPEPGWLMVLLSVVGGMAMAQGLVWFFESV